MRKIYLITLGLICVWNLNAQLLYPDVFATLGGHIENSLVQLTWTAGEPLYETVSSNSGILTQGFNQTVFATTDIPLEPNINSIEVFVFPNPFQSVLNIKFQTPIIEPVWIQLFDLYGRCLIKVKVGSSLGQIHTSHLPSGLYILRITNTKQTLKIFKVVKIK